MRAEDIIEALNKHIEEKRKDNNVSTKGHLVLQRMILANPTFKTYKSYYNTLWFVKNKKEYEVLSVKYVIKACECTEEQAYKRISMELCNSIFNWIGSEYYNQVINGEFIGIKKEF